MRDLLAPESEWEIAITCVLSFQLSLLSLASDT